MDFLDLIKNRHSIRHFKKKEVGDDIIDKILHLTLSAPSAGNLQAYRVVVVKNKEKNEMIARAAMDQDAVREAAVNFIFFAEPAVSASKYEERGKDLFTIQDATIAATYLQLALYYYGLSGVWVGAFKPDEIRDLLGATEDLIPVAIIPAGYSDEEPFATSRRPFDEIVSRENL